MRCRCPSDEGGSDGGGDSGVATAELAVALPTLVTVLLACLWVLAAASTQARCADAARTGARSAARGEPDAVVIRWVRTAVPGARVTVTRSADSVRVEVRRDLRPAGVLGGLLPHVTVEEAVVGPAEPLGVTTAPT